MNRRRLRKPADGGDRLPLKEQNYPGADCCGCEDTRHVCRKIETAADTLTERKAALSTAAFAGILRTFLIRPNDRGGQGLEAGQAWPKTRPAQQIQKYRDIDNLRSHYRFITSMQFPEQRADGFAYPVNQMTSF